MAARWHAVSRSPPETFDAQLPHLNGSRYHVVGFHDLEAYFASGKPLSAKPIIISFDDGWADQFKYAVRILEKYHDTATFFVWTDAIDHRGFLSWRELQALFGGHDNWRSQPFASISWTHDQRKTASGRNPRQKEAGSCRYGICLSVRPIQQCRCRTGMKSRIFKRTGRRLARQHAVAKSSLPIERDERTDDNHGVHQRSPMKFPSMGSIFPPLNPASYRAQEKGGRIVSAACDVASMTSYQRESSRNLIYRNPTLMRPRRAVARPVRIHSRAGSV